MPQLDELSLLVADHRPFEIRVGELPEDLVGRFAHLPLHGDEMLFALPQRVRTVAQDAVQRNAPFFQFPRPHELIDLCLRDAHQLRAKEAGGLGGLGGDVLIAPLHPLVIAISLVLGGFEKRVRPQPFPRAVDGGVELHTRCEHLGTVAQVPAEFLIAGDLLLPFFKCLLPLGIGLEQARQVPLVGRLDLAARG